MSVFDFNRLPDHQVLHEATWGGCADLSIPISAVPGGQSIQATRAEACKVAGGDRVVFAPDVELWVYRSYPIAIAPRRGPASEMRGATWCTRGILVEPQRLETSNEYRGASVVYAVWPDVAAWWEAAPFTLRHPDNVLHYDCLFTSLLPLPDGADIELLGHVRPVEGFLRDGITQRRREVALDSGDQEKVNVRSALMLDPMRLAPELTTGRRAREHTPEAPQDAGPGPKETDGVEQWHWGVVKDLDACIQALLRDPEIATFRKSVMQEDFFVRWNSTSGYRQWPLPSELRRPDLVDELLEQAARYALAGPANFGAYTGHCQRWAKKWGRQTVLDEDPGLPLAFPLMQNVYVSWLDNLCRRAFDQTPAQALSRRPPKTCRPALRARWERSSVSALLDRKLLDLRQKSVSDLAHDLARALSSLPGVRQAPEKRADTDFEQQRSTPPPTDGGSLDPGVACIEVAAAIQFLENRLSAAFRTPGLSDDVRNHLLELKRTREAGRKA